MTTPTPDLLTLLETTAKDRWAQHGLVDQADPTTRAGTLLSIGDRRAALPPVLCFELPGPEHPRVLSVVILLDLSQEVPALDEPGQRARTVERIRATALHIRRLLEDRAHADELRLWAIGPPGSDKSPDWRALRQDVLRDQLICPKNLWLPPTDPGQHTRSLDGFLGETFLAIPWGTDGQSSATENPAALAIQTMATKTKLSREQVDALIALLLNDQPTAEPARRAQPILDWMQTIDQQVGS